jgi:hypothetical protein
MIEPPARLPGPPRVLKGSEIHNEILHDESAAFALDDKFPKSDRAPVLAHFEML